ncbi:MAG: hypothetical protein ACREFD_07620 [Stellaceae bacterium]
MTTKVKQIALAAAIFAVGVTGAGLMPSSAYAYQPRMHNALHDLHHALHALRYGATNKGGHRLEAMRLIEQAIAQIHAGIAYANYH